MAKKSQQKKATPNSVTRRSGALAGRKF